MLAFVRKIHEGWRIWSAGKCLPRLAIAQSTKGHGHELMLGTIRGRKSGWMDSEKSGA